MQHSDAWSFYQGCQWKSKVHWHCFVTWVPAFIGRLESSQTINVATPLPTFLPIFCHKRSSPFMWLEGNLLWGKYLINLRPGTQIHEESFIHSLREVLWIDGIILRMKERRVSTINPRWFSPLLTLNTPSPALNCETANKQLEHLARCLGKRRWSGETL